MSFPLTFSVTEVLPLMTLVLDAPVCWATTVAAVETVDAAATALVPFMNARRLNLSEGGFAISNPSSTSHLGESGTTGIPLEVRIIRKLDEVTTFSGETGEKKIDGTLSANRY
jgi:hypothetical protein